MSLLFKICGIIGLLLITRGIFIHREVKKDTYSAVGGIFLLVYSLYLQDVIFSLLQLVFIVATLYEIWKLKHKPKL
jgi:Ca2+/Na+ antiporter